MPEKSFYFSKSQIASRKEKRTAEEKSKIKVIAGSGTGYVGKTHVCPLANQEFRGSCPIMQCSANVTQYKTEGSCCIYIETGKRDFDKWDLISYLDIKESRLYKYKDIGEKRVTAVVALNRLLGILRAENKKEEYVKDISETSNFISNSYLGLKELQGKFSDVVVIRKNINKIKQFVSNLKTPLTLQELFGTDNLKAIL